jgi:nicotinamidase-related amidase
MTRPPTILDLANVQLAPARIDASALVIIDAQLEYETGRLALPGFGAAVAEIARLLEAARAANAPVIHVIQTSPKGRGIFEEGGPFVAVAPELAPREGEAVVTKRLPNAFAGTDLVERLRAVDRKELVLCGFMTHMCVSASARAALDLGFRSTVVASATATRDLPDPLGGVVPAATVQRAALAELADRFSVVVPTAAALLT